MYSRRVSAPFVCALISLMFLGCSDIISPTSSNHSASQWESLLSPTYQDNIRHLTPIGIDHNNCLYAEDHLNSQILRSTDEGLTWSSSNIHFDNSIYQNFALYSFGVELFFYSSNAVYHSSDQGLHWQSIQFDQVGRSRAFPMISAANHVWYCFGQRGVSQSTNYGSSWSSINNNLTNVAVTSIATVTPNRLFATTENGDFLLYSNQNNQWTTINDRIDSNRIGIVGVTALGRLYAMGSKRVFISNDEGSTWSTIFIGDSLSTSGSSNFSMQSDSHQSILITFGNHYYISSNHGVDWHTLAFGHLFSSRLLLTANSNLIANTSEGLQHSTDLGATWELVGQTRYSISFHSIGITSIGSLLTFGIKIYTPDINPTYYRSSDNGVYWTQTNWGSTSYSGIFLSLSNGTSFYFSNYGESFYRISEDGEQWAVVNSSFSVCKDIVRLPNGDLMAYSTSGKILRSSDDGVTWKLNSGQVQGAPLLTCLCQDRDGWIYVGTRLSYTPTIARSSDYGQTWQLFNRYFAENNQSYYLTNLIVSTTGELYTTAYNATSRILIASRDKGESWEQIGVIPTENGRSVKKMQFDQWNRLYLLYDHGKLWRSSDAGKHFEQLTIPVTPSTINSFVISNNGTLVVATSNGVFRLSNP